MTELLSNIHELGPASFLNRLKGTGVTLLLANGSTVSGTVSDQADYSSVHTKMVHIMTLTGQEYFDAVIPLSSIVGFIFRKPGM